MALADAEYKFTYIDVGSYGRESDGGVFSRCDLSNALETNTINLPPPKPLPQCVEPIPYVIVADDAFPIKTYIMKPFAFRKLDMSQRVRKRLWYMCGILRKPMEMEPEKCMVSVLAICALHNFLMHRKSTYISTTDFDRDVDGEFRPGNWRSELGNNGLRSIEPAAHTGRAMESAIDIRERFKQYFITDGELEWQYDRILGPQIEI